MLKYGKRSDEVINRSVENMERLDKLLAATGKWSRKEAKALIKAGRVRVEDRLPKGPEDKVEEGSLVTVDGRPIFTEKYVYLMLHKPAGVISATQDAKEKTVLDLLPKDLRRKNLFPVGNAFSEIMSLDEQGKVYAGEKCLADSFEIFMDKLIGDDYKDI